MASLIFLLSDPVDGMLGSSRKRSVAFHPHMKSLDCQPRHRALSLCDGGKTKMLEEFKKFALRGNVIDLAVGVIIGAAFGSIVTSIVGDIIMPIIGAITGGLDFSNYYLPLSAKAQLGLSYIDAKKQGAVLGWGQFLTVALNFLIVAWVLFIAIKAINKINKNEPAPPPGPTPEVRLLTEIRDLLKK
jgi:large conductance mechanosensitive channel